MCVCVCMRVLVLFAKCLLASTLCGRWGATEIPLIMITYAADIHVLDSKLQCLGKLRKTGTLGKYHHQAMKEQPQQGQWAQTHKVMQTNLNVQHHVLLHSSSKVMQLLARLHRCSNLNTLLPWNNNPNQKVTGIRIASLFLSLSLLIFD